MVKRKSITLFYAISADAPPGLARMHDEISGQLYSLSLFWPEGSDARRYLQKLSEVHRSRAASAVKPPKKIQRLKTR